MKFLIVKHILLVMVTAMFLTACGGDDGADGQNGESGIDDIDGASSLIV